MRSHLAKSTVAVAMFLALFARVHTADAQVRSLYMPGLNTIKSAPPGAGLTYAVIVVIPVAFTPRATITFGRIAAAAPAADSHDAHVVVGSRSDPQEASPFRLHATGCRSSGTNVIVSAIIRF